MSEIAAAAQLIKESHSTIVFTGAGISVESGIPPFRGSDGLWSQYDPVFIDIDYFHANPEKSWETIHEIFYSFIGNATPNPAHHTLARFERNGYVKAIITQNIDGLHQKAGSTCVYEFHGTIDTLSCTFCHKRFNAFDMNLDETVPLCDACSSLLKPDFIFFGEQIDPAIIEKSLSAVKQADVLLVIGTTGEVMPACTIPYHAQEHGAKIIEINPVHSHFTNTITDYYIPMSASSALTHIAQLITDGAR